MPSAVFANTTATSEMLPFVIQRFVPFRSQPPLTFSAFVSMPPGLLPKSGSVSPKQPTFSPWTIAGSHFSCCAFVPKAWIGCMTRLFITEAKERRPESPRSSSR